MLALIVDVDVDDNAGRPEGFDDKSSATTHERAEVPMLMGDG